MKSSNFKPGLYIIRRDWWYYVDASKNTIEESLDIDWSLGVFDGKIDNFIYIIEESTVGFSNYTKGIYKGLTIIIPHIHVTNFLNWATFIGNNKLARLFYL
jgi:hypothetical protein